MKAEQRVTARIRTSANTMRVMRATVKGPIPGVHGAYWVLCDGEHHCRACGAEALEPLNEAKQGPPKTLKT